MTKKQNQLTDKQFQINQRSAADTEAAKEWLVQAGFNSNTFGTTHIRLLQAQQQAHALLTHHSNLLTHSQCTALDNFLQLMTHKRTRDRLKPTATNSILNISSKINRQLFKQHKSLAQAQH